MSAFEPLAVVGRGCVLPDALTPAALWENIVAKKSAVTDVPEGRWGIAPQRILAPKSQTLDATHSTKGGYVQGFDDVFDASNLRIDPSVLDAFDPVVKWPLHATQQALAEAGLAADGAHLERTAVIMGNLSFPTEGMARFGERIFLETQAAFGGPLASAFEATKEARGGRPADRFMSGLPAQLIASAFGFEGEAFCLDAACASSLYAVALAANALQSRRADVVLCGAVNAADSLFLHVGFTALGALSATGQTRPFHREANGLIPGEGAGMVALMRLDDARAEGRPIFGVVRGVGLSNDGRGRNLLAPSSEGQIRALRAAYQSAGLSPADVSLLECHATGTPVGDGTEVESMRAVFGGANARRIGIGSLKSNLGHLITGAGIAGMLKVMGAFEHRTLPPTLHVDDPLPVFEDVSLPFRLLREPEPWENAAGAFAGVSAFGFGGNNAHVVLQAPTHSPVDLPSEILRAAPKTVVTAMGYRSDTCESLEAWAHQRLAHQFDNVRNIEPTSEDARVRVDAKGVRFPPNALKASLPQQLLAFEAIREAAATVEEAVEAGALDRNRVGVLVGMQCDVEVTTPGVRWRIAEWADPTDEAPEWVEALRDGVGPIVTAERVLGQMPNIPANRANVQHDFRGLGFTLSSDELSGLNALRVGQDLLESGTLDAVIVAAVDVCHDERHQAALRALVGQDVPASDAAVALVLRREDDIADTETPLATLDEVALGWATSPARPQDVVVTAGGTAPVARGHAQAASGLLAVAAAVLDVGRATDADGKIDLQQAQQRVHVTSLGGGRGTVMTRPHSAIAAASATGLPQVLALSAPTRAALVENARTLVADKSALASALHEPTGNGGNARLAVVGTSVDDIAQQLRAFSEANAPLCDDAKADVAFREGPALYSSQVTLAFGGAASPPAQAGKTLLQAFPHFRRALDEKTGSIADAFGHDHFRAKAGAKTYLDQILAGSSLMQLHALVVRDALGLDQTSALGLSLGESNALMAMGAWAPQTLMDRVRTQPLFQQTVAGRFEAARQYFADHAIGVDEEVWTSAVVRGDVAKAVAAADAEPGAFVTLVHADDECVVAGAPAAVRRVLKALGRDGAIVPLAPAVHTPAARSAADAYRALHTVDTLDTGARIFSAGALAAFGDARLPLDQKACADAITAQAVERVDFPALLRAAHGGGTRLLIACGARGLCAEWARRTSLDGELTALALHRVDVPEARQLARVAAALFVHGLPVDLSAFAPVPEKAGALYFDVPLVRSPSPLPLPNAAPTSDNATSDLPPNDVAPLLGDVEDSSMPNAPKLPLPSFEATAPVPPPAGGTMAPAPTLDRMAVAPQTSTRSAPPVSVAAQVAPAVPLAAASAPSAATDEGPWATVAQAQAELGEAHRAYMTNAAAMHQTFLEQQKRQVQQLAQLMQSGSPLPSASSAPVTAPAPVAHAKMPSAMPSVRPEAPRTTTAAPALPKPALQPSPKAAPPSPRPKPQSPANAEAKAKAMPAPTGAPHTDGRRETPWLNRSALERVASDKISTVLGDVFKRQDSFRRQVRMPEPPLLLCDRVLCTDATAGVLEKGRTIWTESDVTWDKWYVHHGRVPPSVLIESGQADLLLISFMGVDFENAGQRVYRLLGCDLTYGDSLPAVGETLHYDIHIDGFARTGKTHMFFFHSDCRLGGPDGEIVLSVRNGQAGFFDDEELRNSGGILWTPDDLEEDLNRVSLAAPVVANVKESLSKEELVAWTNGDGYACFGAGYEALAPHVRTPAIQGETGHGQDMRLIDRVTKIDPKGGPWRRGYLRAELDLYPEQWFFQGHFKDDPCMPGTIMFEGCLQTLSTYLAALGFTTDADGYRFEPVGHKPYSLRCRGQAIPTSKNLVYEVFVKEVVGGALPKVRADILVTVDGLKALHCDDVELELVVDWPMSDRPDLLGDVAKESGKDAVGGVVPPGAKAPDAIFDQTALLATGWGRPSDAFGEMYKPFDGTRRVPRLPGPPYHFMSRVTELDGPPQGAMKAGVRCAVEYDVPADAWFFDDSPAETMPFCVLLEVALQPCGWLSSYVGSALTSEGDLFYRNLDGQGTLHAEIPRDVGTLITRAEMTKSSMSGGMIIQEFSLAVTARQADGSEKPIYDATTAFGFFPAAALAQQVGVGSTPAQKAELAAQSPVPTVEILRTPQLFEGPLKLPKAPLLMIDRVTGQWPAEGDHLGRLRTEKTVDVTEWFFKAHFFQDPVQPGSLGIEAMIQAVTFWMIENQMGAEMKAPRITPLALGKKMIWKYRGQVIPKNKKIEVDAIIRSKTDSVVVADCSLWVDGLRIYTAEGLSVGIVDAG